MTRSLLLEHIIEFEGCQQDQERDKMASESELMPFKPDKSREATGVSGFAS